MTKTAQHKLRSPAMARLSREQWQAIRTIWEYDPDQPSYNTAAGRAAKKHQFAPPGKSTIDDRAKKEGWERRGNMTGINAAAQRKADTLTDSNGRYRTLKRHIFRARPVLIWSCHRARRQKTSALRQRPVTVLSGCRLLCFGRRPWRCDIPTLTNPWPR